MLASPTRHGTSLSRTEAFRDSVGEEEEYRRAIRMPD